MITVVTVGLLVAISACNPSGKTQPEVTFKNLVISGEPCALLGSHGKTASGIAMICKPSTTDPKYRWREDN